MFCSEGFWPKDVEPKGFGVGAAEAAGVGAGAEGFSDGGGAALNENPEKGFFAVGAASAFFSPSAAFTPVAAG